MKATNLARTALLALIAAVGTSSCGLTYAFKNLDARWEEEVAPAWDMGWWSTLTGPFMTAMLPVTFSFDLLVGEDPAASLKSFGSAATSALASAGRAAAASGALSSSSGFGSSRNSIATMMANSSAQLAAATKRVSPRSNTYSTAPRPQSKPRETSSRTVSSSARQRMEQRRSVRSQSSSSRDSSRAAAAEPTPSPKSEPTYGVYRQVGIGTVAVPREWTAWKKCDGYPQLSFRVKLWSREPSAEGLSKWWVQLRNDGDEFFRASCHIREIGGGPNSDTNSYSLTPGNQKGIYMFVGSTSQIEVWVARSQY